MSEEPERNSQLLEVGKQCSHSTCLLVDFLPLKCTHCSQPFCAEHFLPEAHTCEKYDVAKYDRVAPSCPLCNTPVAIPLGEDPNISMERHIHSECSVANPSPKPKSAPRCPVPRCGKVLFSPIPCGSCHEQFCPTHRFAKDHSCSGSRPVASTSTSSAILKGATSAANRASAASAAAGRAAVARITTTKNMRKVPNELDTSKSTAPKDTSASLSVSNLATHRTIFPLSMSTSKLANPTIPDGNDNDMNMNQPANTNTSPLTRLSLSFVPRPIFGVA